MSQDKRLTRRRLMAALPVVSAAPLPAQTPSPSGELEQARQNVQRNRDQLAKIRLAPSAEPAFKFTA